ncbi:unnamed protein product [Paramecium pentaurelia]|uniref:Uncharacterized protein n=1 Tax=Paramecium pentaurelia TaxID=43138 RepID=A0A8S1U8K3_9CILI|nr:unnamed protein product [Paramecium pentaurelia]
MNLNIPQLKGGYGNLKSLNPLDQLAKETEEDVSEIDRLQKRLNEQQQKVDALMKVVSNSQQSIYLSQDRYKHTIESERFNSQLLDEIKNLKKQLKQIESGPRLPQAPFMPPFLPQQQYPFSYHLPNNQMAMPYPIPNQNPYYQFYPFQNMPFQQPQKEERSFSKILKGLAKKKEEEQLNQIMLQLLKNSQNDPDNEHQQKQKSRRNLKVKHKSHQDSSDFQFSKSSRYEEEQSEHMKKKQNKKQSIKPQEQQLPLLNQSSKLKLQPLRIKPTPERLKLLKKKFKYCAWMVIFYKNKYYQIMEKKAIKRFEDEVGLYDDQFQYNNAISQFVKEGQKLSLFKKSWVFTEKKDVPTRINNLIQAAETFIKQLIIVTQIMKFDQKHISYIKAFTTNDGYLFPAHSAFVAQRLQLNYNRKLKFTSKDQQRMAFLEYTYIQLLLYEQIFSVSGWQELLKPFAEPLKLLVSLLQYLFIDKFKNLQIISKNIKFNIEQVPILDFTQRNVADIKQSINQNDPKFQVTDKFPILGLYDETVLKPVIESPGFSNLQNQFKVFVEYIYSKLE